MKQYFTFVVVAYAFSMYLIVLSLITYNQITQLLWLNFITGVGLLIMFAIEQDKK